MQLSMLSALVLMAPHASPKVCSTIGILLLVVASVKEFLQ